MHKSGFCQAWFRRQEEKSMAWTDDRVEMLSKLWAEGLSASQIATRMGGVTRNAVIGKVHRLGLSGRGRPTKATRAKPVKQKPSMPRAPRNPMPVAGNTALKPATAMPAPEVKAEPSPVREVKIPPGERRTILTLTEHTCKWPIGDPGDRNFHFCGRKSDTGIPYCTEHAAIAYQVPLDRRRKKAAS